MASFKCKDMEMKCNFEVKDDDQDEMIKIIFLHTERTHNMKQPLPSEMMAKMRIAIKK
jgi:predicted small metal-binding protein